MRPLAALHCRRDKKTEKRGPSSFCTNEVLPRQYISLSQAARVEALEEGWMGQRGPLALRPLSQHMHKRKKLVFCRKGGSSQNRTTPFNPFADSTDHDWSFLWRTPPLLLLLLLLVYGVKVGKKMIWPLKALLVPDRLIVQLKLSSKRNYRFVIVLV